MDLTEQQQQRINACLATIEQCALLNSAAMGVVSSGKVRTINVTNSVQDASSKALRAVLELRTLLDVPLLPQEQ
jgi:hypothetical protein